MMPAIFSPRPVSVTTPTMMPAVAVVAATPSTSVAARLERRQQPRGRQRRLAPQEAQRRRPARVAQNTALNADMPSTMRTAIATSEVKWYQ